MFKEGSTTIMSVVPKEELENLKEVGEYKIPIEMGESKMPPELLLSKGSEYGMFGDAKEIEDILKEGRNDLVRDDVDRETENEKIKEKTEYSDDVNDCITTEEELEVYQDEELEEGKVNDTTTLKDTTIDPDQKDDNGRTNLERMKDGLAPLDENGRPYNLHHIGQKKDSPLAELKEGVHRKNDGVLHDKTKPSEIDRKEFAKEKAEHWKARAVEIEEQQKGV